MNRRDMLNGPALGAAGGALLAGGLISPAQAQGDVRAQLAGASLVEEIKRRGTLRVGLSTFVPWAMRNRGGELVGFEVDVATRLAADMNVRLELVPTAWDGIIPALLAGRFDAIIGGMSVTIPRNLTVNFTDPYHQTGIGIFANKRLADGWATLAQFNRPDVTIVARRGTPAANSVGVHMPRATLRQFDEEAPALQEVVNGRAHAMVGSIPLPAHSVKRYPDVLVRPFNEPYQRAISAFAVRKSDIDALNLFNNWIRLRQITDSFLADRAAYWFDGLDWEDQIQR
ncbi:transporter substrate-binding domain-containing protein [Elioraea rosea]|uniref:transporter substrate-binding domain-containing protein n=1 Tax=Elioraea rosea TaxID=2492390 RepID=UPI001952178F|nr:transporter substrate-binding domain-containing protein [Elioraea rosea]